jgi:hypothetical protein
MVWVPKTHPGVLTRTFAKAIGITGGGIRNCVIYPNHPPPAGLCSRPSCWRPLSKVVVSRLVWRSRRAGLVRARLRQGGRRAPRLTRVRRPKPLLTMPERVFGTHTFGTPSGPNEANAMALGHGARSQGRDRSALRR